MGFQTIGVMRALGLHHERHDARAQRGCGARLRDRRAVRPGARPLPL